MRDDTGRLYDRGVHACRDIWFMGMGSVAWAEQVRSGKQGRLRRRRRKDPESEGERPDPKPREAMSNPKTRKPKPTEQKPILMPR